MTCKLIVRCWVVVSLGCCVSVGTASAQVCEEEDASSTCSGDAGSDDGGALSSDFDAGWLNGPPKACSCTSNFDPDQNGTLHVCTGSLDEDTCATFTCEQGRRAAAACDDEDVRMCCEMKSRKLYSQLYGDCTHPRCELGFRAQCEELGGRIHSGPCQVPAEYVRDEGGSDDDGDGCSAIPGRPRNTQSPAWGLLAAAAAWLFVRRRRH